MDAQIGKVLDALETSGQADQTIVVFTSDHGFHIGERGLWGKTSNFEQDARVPLIIASPRHRRHRGQATRSLVELVDLFPTVAQLSHAGGQLPSNLDGVSLLPILRDPGATVKDVARTEHPQPFYGSRKNWKAIGYSLRNDRWRYTQWRSLVDQSVIAQELYDHDRDPQETVNLAASPSRRAIVEQLSRQLGIPLSETRR